MIFIACDKLSADHK